MGKHLTLEVAKINRLAKEGKIRFTHKALREISRLEMDLDVDDVCSMLQEIKVKYFWEKTRSDKTGEWMYIFKPIVAGITIYLKIIMRSDCIVISFHEDTPQSEE